MQNATNTTPATYTTPATKHACKRYLRKHAAEQYTSKVLGGATLAELQGWCNAVHAAATAPAPAPTPATAAPATGAAEVTPAQLAALLAEVQALRAEVQKRSTKRAPGALTQNMQNKANTLLGYAQNGTHGCSIDAAGMLTLTAEGITSAGYSTAYAHLSNGWGSTKPAGMGFAVLGYRKLRCVSAAEHTLHTRKGMRKPHTVYLVPVAPAEGSGAE